MLPGNMKYIAWKILEDNEGSPRFIFCALDGTRNIEMDLVLTAEKKQVSDGGKAEYESGFHIVTDLSDMVAYSQRFTKLENKVVAQVYYESAVEKPTRGSLAMLASRMRLTPEQWEERVPLRHYKELKR